MYPKVFADYAKHLREHGPVDVLPTPVFFYGMTPGQEIAVDLEPGKTLVIRCQAVGDLPGAIGRGVVDHQHVAVDRGFLEHRQQAAHERLEVLALVVRGHAHPRGGRSLGISAGHLRASLTGGVSGYGGS